MKVIISLPAAADLDCLISFLLKNNPTAASRAATTLRSAIRSLDTIPERGGPSKLLDTRELIVPFGRSAYVVRYSVASDEVIVLRIWHGRENRS
jgi:plasmid stabilization system protein ParE